jgi:23S rRNA (uracil1939-C5)-methyltransferase
VDHKEAIIRESLARLGQINWNRPIKRITGPDRNYRLRATFHVTTNGRLGFTQEKTNEVVPIPECASLVPELNEFIPYANSILERGIVEVHAVSGPAVAANFVFENGSIKALMRGGAPILHVGSYKYKLNADSFFQANRFLLSPFIEEVITQAGPAPEHVLELYSGTGFFSVPLARVSTEVIGVEGSNSAVRYGHENAKLNNVWNLRFMTGEVAATLKAAEVHPDVVVLDPPRAGCGVSSVKDIARLAPRRIVYVSCNPSTFAREAQTLIGSGYGLTHLTLIDQFPNTYHIEMVAGFDRKNGDSEQFP